MVTNDHVYHFLKVSTSNYFHDFASIIVVDDV